MSYSSSFSKAKGSLTALVYFLILTSCEQSKNDYRSEKIRQASIEEVQVSEVIEETKEVMHDFDHTNVGSIRSLIKTNLSIIEDITIRLERDDSFSETFPYIVRKINDLADAYEDLAEKRIEIRDHLNRKLFELDVQAQVVDRKIGLLRRDIANKRRKMAGMEEYQKKSFEIQIKFIEQEVEIWKRFKNKFDIRRISSKFRKARDGINKFVDILYHNGLVYRQAAQTLNAMNDYRHAEKAINEIIALEELGESLVASWDDLALIMDSAFSQIDDIENEFNEETG